MPTVFAEGRLRPLVGTAEPDGINAAAVALPVVRKFVPSNVSALPVVSTLLAFRYATPLAVPPESVVLPATVNVPERLKLVLELLLSTWNRVPSYTTATSAFATKSPATNAVDPSRVNAFAPNPSMFSVAAVVLVLGTTKVNTLPAAYALSEGDIVPV
jgi:hypothetical protein